MGVPRYLQRPPATHAVSIQLRKEGTTFTTDDSVDGDVQVTPGTDVHFGDLEILFLGTSRSSVLRIAPVARDAGKDQAFHIFLRQSQPDVRNHFPQDGILRGGQTYTFPFVFIIPAHLLPDVCRHAVVDETVRDAHSQLPPTFGDNDLMRQLDLPDDLSPINASVRYGVYARLTKEEQQHGDESRTVVLASRAYRIRVVPHLNQPEPLHLDTTGDCRLRQEQVIRNKKFTKSGSIVVEIERPQSFRLAPPNSLRRGSVSTKASIALRFDPVDERVLPPSLGKLAVVLKTYTYFASSKREHLPTARKASEDATQAMHLHQHVLSRRSMAGIEWTRISLSEGHGGPWPGQLGVPEPSKAYKGKAYYHARVLIPMTLPPDATFVPTFHSCLLSRVYELEMRLKVQDGGVWDRAVSLKMPAHVSSEREERRPTYDETMEARERGSDSADATCATLIAHVPQPRRQERQDSVISYGHFGVRVEELPAYTRR